MEYLDNTNEPSYIVSLMEETHTGPKCSVHRQFMIGWKPGSNIRYVRLHTIMENEKFFKERVDVIPMHSLGLNLLIELVMDFQLNKKKIESSFKAGELENWE